MTQTTSLHINGKRRFFFGCGWQKLDGPHRQYLAKMLS
jgi:hypothetical protein